MKGFIGVTDNDRFAFLSQKSGINEKRRVYSIHTVSVKRI